MDTSTGTTVHLPPELESFAQGCARSGRFGDVGEVVRSGLRLLQEAEERRAAFIASLDRAVAKGEREGFLTLDEVEQSARLAIEAVRVHK